MMGARLAGPNTRLFVLPALIRRGRGSRRALSFVAFFTVTIRDKNTRAAYASAAA
jgi:hypothetical protein